MSLDVEDVLKKMLDVGVAAFGAEWKHVSKFVPTEFRKMALQLVDIAENVALFEADPEEGYPPATGRVLLQMQQRALEATLTAVTALTLITIQKAIGDVLKVLKETFGGVLKELIP